MRVRGAVFVSALVLSAAGCGPAVTVSHLVPAPYNLGPARRLVLVEVSGAARAWERTTRSFLGQVSEGGVLSIRDATPEGFRLASLGSGAAARDAKAFRGSWPADVYVGLGVEVQSRARSEHRKKKTDSGEVEVVRHYAEADCELRVRLLDARDGRELAAFSVDQSAVSDRGDSFTPRMREEAEGSAIDAAVADAVSQFTPRRVEDRIALDEKAPLAAEGLKLVDAGDLAGARSLWERALDANRESAPLRYNLGALCEALRDRRAARRYYEDAIRLSPANPDYQRALDALDALDARQRDTKALKNPG
jgi:tetratricopeptide (TPR) repeat protein